MATVLKVWAMENVAQLNPKPRLKKPGPTT